MSHVFISYSKKNREYARKLADHLLSLGFDVWIDDRIDYGDDWWRTIVRAIRGSKAFIVIMTDDSDISEWVQREVTLADKHKIPAFPVWLEGDFHTSENWAIYVRTQYADMREGELPEESFYKRLSLCVPRKMIKGSEVAQAFSMPKLVLPDVLTVLPPPFEWCEISSGEVTIQHSNDEDTFDVSAFAIAKHLITNKQYQVFLEAQDGYRESRWWEYSPAAQSWRQENSKPHKTGFEGDSLPRTNVTWYEAVAFCKWLTRKIRFHPTSSSNEGEIQIALPTEQQWQHAAQGDDGRLYPWGNQFDSMFCNTLESGIRKPTPVTHYSNSVSPYGVMDMSGNV